MPQESDPVRGEAMRQSLLLAAMIAGSLGS